MDEKDEDDGLKLLAFSKKFAAYCRFVCTSHDAEEMGMSWQDGACKRVAERTGEPVSIIHAVYRGEHDPTKPMLDDMEWFGFESYETVTVRVKVTKYLPKRVQIKSSTIHPIFRL